MLVDRINKSVLSKILIVGKEGNYGKIITTVLKDKYDLYCKKTHKPQNSYEYVIITCPLHYVNTDILAEYDTRVYLHMSCQGYCIPLHKNIIIKKRECSILFFAYGIYHTRDGTLNFKYDIVNCILFNRPLPDYHIFEALNVIPVFGNNIEAFIYNNHNQLLHSTIIAHKIMNPPKNTEKENDYFYDMNNMYAAAITLSKVTKEIKSLNVNTKYNSIENYFHYCFLFRIGYFFLWFMRVSGDYKNVKDDEMIQSRMFMEDVISLYYIKTFSKKRETPHIDLILGCIQKKYNIDYKDYHYLFPSKPIDKIIRRLHKRVII